MNWLAHIFLSENCIDFQLGNYLADPLKMRFWDNASDNIIKGMQAHKFIDSFTDNHEIIKSSKSKLCDKGLLRLVVLDLTYDYLLSKNWDKFCSVNFEEFTNSFYKKALKRKENLPLHTYIFIDNMINHQLLNNYQNLEDLEKAFIRMDKKLSQKLLQRDTTIRYYQTVKDNIKDLENDFLEFFPILCKELKDNNYLKNTPHWKI